MNTIKIASVINVQPGGDGTRLKDPMNIFLQDFEPGQGRVVVECVGDAWAAYFNAMGKDRKIIDFLAELGEDYLAQKLDPSDGVTTKRERYRLADIANDIIKTARAIKAEQKDLGEA